MKILFLTYPRIGLDQGGLQIQIQSTAKALLDLGIEVVFFDPWKNQIDNIDVCHMFATDLSMRYHVERAKQRNKPVVISSVYNAFGSSVGLLAAKVFLSNRVPGLGAGFSSAYKMLSSAERVIALNQREKKLLHRVFHLESGSIQIIPNGIDAVYGKGEGKLFEKKYGTRNFILEVGSIGPRKNQLTLIRAAKNLPYPLVIVGGPEGEDSSYLERCRQEAGENTLFTGYIRNDNPLLASAYAASKLFVLPSFSEVMPLSLYEAATAGCLVLASRNFPVAEELQCHIPRFDPEDVHGLEKLIKQQMEAPANAQLTAAARSMPTWRQVGEEILAVYKEVCGIR